MEESGFGVCWAWGLELKALVGWFFYEYSWGSKFVFLFVVKFLHFCKCQEKLFAL
jgi:hypothetical protein